MKKVILVTSWLISISLITFVLLNPGDFFIEGTLILGWLLFTFQITLKNSEKAYIYWSKAKYFVINPSCSWNMNIEFKGEFSHKTFSEIENVLANHYIRIDNILELSNQRKLYRVKNLNIEIIIDHDRISFDIQNLKVSYRDSNNIIENEISSLFEKLQNKIRTEEINYNLIVNFQGQNPYYGLYINQLNAEHINYFNIHFKLDKEKVTVSDHDLEINTTELSQLRMLTKKYLTLSPR